MTDRRVDRSPHGHAYPPPQPRNSSICISTRKIFDSCRDKDCIEDLVVYPLCDAVRYIETAEQVRAKSATLLYVFPTVEEIAFNRGFYTIDLRYYYKIDAEAQGTQNKPVPIRGLCVFDKRLVLFGSESRAKTFTSDSGLTDYPAQEKGNLPVVVVENLCP